MKVLLEKEEVRLPQVFDETSSRVSEFLEECRRYIKRKMKEVKMEDQIYWVISYVQGGAIDKWKEKMVDKIFEDKWKNRYVEEVLKDIEKEFGEKDKGKGKKVEKDI